MATEVKLFGAHGGAITDLSSWLEQAPPEKGLAQWVDGYSAKEQAKAWFRTGGPAVPTEICAAITALGLPDAELVEAWPEHKTPFDDLGRSRQHDLLAVVNSGGRPAFVVGVEAKACESFDTLVAERSKAEAPSKKRKRCNLLSQALFGRKVMAEDHDEILDAELAGHGYQLWTSAVGTIVETQKRGLDEAVLVIHQLRPQDLGNVDPSDTRNWAAALAKNDEQLTDFQSAFGGMSHDTEFVAAGTKLYVLKVESWI